MQAMGRGALERDVLVVFVLPVLNLLTVASAQQVLLAQAAPSHAIPSKSPPNVTPIADEVPL